MLEKRRKYLWIAGGFGNVLFQLLAQESLSKHGERVYIVPVLTQKNLFTRILKWRVHEEVYREIIESNDIIKISAIRSAYVLLFAYLSKHLKTQFKVATFYSADSTRDMDYAKNIFGYFQHPDFLKSNQDALLKLGRLLRNKYSMNEKLPVVVHYRKGDSVWAQKHTHYYHEVRLLLQNEKLPTLIVTDDLKSCNDVFGKIDNCSFVSSENAIDDFMYLVSAQKLICAPSTFSWWAAHSLPSDTHVVMPVFFEENLGIYIERDRVKII